MMKLAQSFLQGQEFDSLQRILNKIRQKKTNQFHNYLDWLQQTIIHNKSLHLFAREIAFTTNQTKAFLYKFLWNILFLNILFCLTNMSLKKGSLICHQFKILRKLGSGAYVDVFMVQNIEHSDQVFAAKVEKTHYSHSRLKYQEKVYKALKLKEQNVGFSKIHKVLNEERWNVMLMQLLGPNLQDVFMLRKRRLSLKTVLMLTYQMLERIKFIHEREIIHGDIKPDNFVFGGGNNSQYVYLCDFSLAKRYIIDKKHIEYKKGKQILGTLRYMSINVHEGIQKSRRDDLQSLSYVLIYFLKGDLPWQNLKFSGSKSKERLIYMKKKSTCSKLLCDGLPRQVELFTEYCRKLKFEEQPEYDYLFSLLIEIMRKQSIEMDYDYDWKVNNKTGEKQNEECSISQKNFSSTESISAQEFDS